MHTVDVGGFTVGAGHPPRVMGVLNMSVESNYTPSVRGDAPEAARFAEEMAAAGADIIDVGLQSANPKNEWLPPEVERDRLAKALAVVDAADTDAAFSLETRYAEVAEAGIEGGFDMVNDVCGFADPKMKAVCADHDVPVVKMASPPDLRKPGHLRSVEEVFAALERGGFTERTILDPAFGQWHPDITYEDNWRRFRRLREFRAFGRPLLTATNREDFLGDIADRPATEDQLPVSLAAATMEVERGAHIVRTHDVPETSDVVQVAHFLGDERALGTDPRVAELADVGHRELERHLHLRDGAGEAASLSPLCFQVERLAAEAEGFLADWTAGRDALFAQGGEIHLLAGTVAAFRDGVGALAEGPGELPEVAGTVRRALAREGE
ncbi:MAG: dihydropteroate synthase [Halorientalis sp.]